MTICKVAKEDMKTNLGGRWQDETGSKRREVALKAA